jgi:hypothetical protein
VLKPKKAKKLIRDEKRLMRQIQTQAEQTWPSPPVEAVELDPEYHDGLLRAMESAYAEDSFFKHLLPARGVPSTECAGLTVPTTPLKDKSAARLIYTKGDAPRLCISGLVRPGAAGGKREG